MITDSDISGANADHPLKADDGSCSRDTLVRILRLFILRAEERRTRKGKKSLILLTCMTIVSCVVDSCRL